MEPLSFSKTFLLAIDEKGKKITSVSFISVCNIISRRTVVLVVCNRKIVKFEQIGL